MNILLESTDTYVLSLLENKLNENDEFVVFNVLKELGSFEDYGKNKPLPLFQSFMAKFECALESVSNESKSLVLEGMGYFFKEGRLSILEKSYIEWSLSELGCVVVDIDHSETATYITSRFLHIPYSSATDFYMDLKAKLLDEDKKFKNNYLIKTFRALESAGNFIGNFKAQSFYPLKKVNIESVISKLFELGNVDQLVDDFKYGKIAFYKDSHPFQIFLTIDNAKN